MLAIEYVNCILWLVSYFFCAAFFGASDRGFQSILGIMRAEKRLDILAEKHQRTEMAGRSRSLLAKVCKMQEDLDSSSHTLDRRVDESDKRSGEFEQV